MRRDTPAIIVLILAGVLIAGSFIASLCSRPKPVEESIRPHIRSVLELGRVSGRKKALVVGYNYYLLERYAESNGQTIEIDVTRDSISWLDSLKAGRVDILVVPLEDSLRTDSVLVSMPVDSLCVWLMRHDDRCNMDDVNRWLAEWHECEEHDEVSDSYLKRFDAFRSRRRGSISPYDSLIRAHADSLGWDWRLLAAVIYQESRFHIEAQSRRGAAGLMQMMPRTAKRYGVSDPLSPEENIRGGAQLLSTLIRRYYDVGADDQERYKYALAAYNAGVGRVDDIIRLAELRGVDTAHWDTVISVIPEMNEETVRDTEAVRLGPFKGKETIAYVRRVMEIYGEFRRICPDYQ
jgi:membrane-bound lytic murein transglycosylase MltF